MNVPPIKSERKVITKNKHSCETFSFCIVIFFDQKATTIAESMLAGLYFTSDVTLNQDSKTKLTNDIDQKQTNKINSLGQMSS